MSGTSEAVAYNNPRPEPIPVECPHCQAAAFLTAVQGDRCPGCQFEFTLFEPDQEIVLNEFYRVLTGAKYIRDLPGGAKVVVHG